MKYVSWLVVIAFFLVPMVVTADLVGHDPVDPVGISNPLKGSDSLQGFVKVVLENIVLPIGSVVIVFMIIYSGFLFVTARGNESKLETAKHTLLYVIIGAAVLLGSVAISKVIDGTLCEIAPDLPNCGRPVGSPSPTVTPFGPQP